MVDLWMVSHSRKYGLDIKYFEQVYLVQQAVKYMPLLIKIHLLSVLSSSQPALIEIFRQFPQGQKIFCQDKPQFFNSKL